MKIKIYSLDEIGKKLKEFCTSNVKLAFWATIIILLIVHFQLYSQEIMNTDGLWNSIYDIAGNWEVSLGRWGIYFVNLLRGSFVSPIVTSIISIVIIAITCVMIVKLLKINKKYTIVLMFALLASLPSFCNTLTYPYCADAYTLAMFFAVIAVYCIYKYPKIKGIILGGIALAVSLGLYQGYVGVCAVLCLIMLLLQIIENKDIKEVGHNTFRSILLAIMGIIIYYAITQIFLKIYQVSLASYGGANENSSHWSCINITNCYKYHRLNSTRYRS